MTEIVGILNVTPDSFADGGQWNDPRLVLDRVQTLFDEGASIVDIGAESTRPGANTVRNRDEWQRLKPIIANLREHHPANKFSIDTRHARVASLAIQYWSNELMINDVSGLYDPQMLDLVATQGTRVVISHLPAEAEGDTKKAHSIKETSLDKVITELHTTIARAIDRGVDPANIIADPGIGFGKSPELNQKLITFARYTSYPTMIGYSQKGFLGPQRYEAGYNAEMGKLAANWGAKYLRVHHVGAHVARLQSRYYR